MKKLFSIIALACMSCLSISAQTVAQCMLMHGETATLYSNENIQQAIDDAEAGDMIQLTEGTFPGFTLTKDVQIKGAGQNTFIRENIDVEIPDNPTLNRVLLSGFHCNSDLNLNTEMSGLQINKVSVNSVILNAKNTNAFFDKCYVRDNFHYNENWVNCNVINSKIKYVYNWSICNEPVVTFTNCNIYNMYSNGNNTGTYYRCIVYYRCGAANTDFIQSLFYAGDLSDGSQEVGCWQVSFEFDVDIEFPYSTEDMISNGWVGDDGNVVGIYGGDNPYTLVVSGPKVTESSISVDAVNRILDVSLKVSAN